MRPLCFLVLTLVLCALGTAPVTGQEDMNITEVRDLYARKVLVAEWMVRLKQGVSSGTDMTYENSHSGVRVTLEGTPDQYLIHKGLKNSGWFRNKNVITDARHMSSEWTVKDTRNYNGRVTVKNMMAAGGTFYFPLGANCYDAAKAMMNL